MPLEKHNYNLQTHENPLLISLELFFPPSSTSKLAMLTITRFFPLFSSYIYNLLTDSQSIQEATTAVLEDFLKDGVIYLELRTTPRKTTHLTHSELISTILSTINAFEASHPQMHTRLILSIDRRHDLETASQVVDLALQFQDQGVVGIDLCGDPRAKPDGEIAVFTPAFRRAKEAGLGITVHFAEAKESASPSELETLLSWSPGRLGHVIWESDVVKDQIVKQGLSLELCVSCNVQAEMGKGGKEFGEHHFGEWWAKREKVMIALSVSLPPSPALALAAPL